MWYQHLLLTATTQIPVCEMSCRWVIIGEICKDNVSCYLAVVWMFNTFCVRTGWSDKGWWWWSVRRATLCLVGYIDCNVCVCSIRCFANLTQDMVVHWVILLWHLMSRWIWGHSGQSDQVGLQNGGGLYSATWLKRVVSVYHFPKAEFENCFAA